MVAFFRSFFLCFRLFCCLLFVVLHRISKLLRAQRSLLALLFKYIAVNDIIVGQVSTDIIYIVDIAKAVMVVVVSAVAVAAAIGAVMVSTTT